MRRIPFRPRSWVPVLTSIGLSLGCGEPEVTGTQFPAASLADPNGSAPVGVTPVGTDGPVGVTPVGTDGPVGVTPVGTDGPVGVTPVGTDGPGVGAGGAGSVDGQSPVAPTDCSGTANAASKRIVRLSFNQIANSIGTLIDPSLTSQLAVDNAILDSKHRAFPPLQSPREGSAITDGQWTTIDAMASAGAQYVFDNFDAVTGCAADPTDSCAQTYLSTLAEQAYRRPLTTDEQGRIDALYGELQAEPDATVAEITQHVVYAILQAPQFVYRTELGDDWAVDGALTQYELASTLSYFLTDDMPDQLLLEAAAQGQLSTSDLVAAQVDRILEIPTARQNLADAMLSYFNYQGLENVVIQDPQFTDGVAASMYHEGELFLSNTLWSGELNDLLLSKKSVVNAGLAEIYGISPFPQAGTTPDADGFAPVDLPDNRSGLVTMPGFLSTRSRPTETSVVGRGLLIKNAFLCTDTPAPPDNLAEEIADVSEMQAEQTERQKAEYRQTTSPCSTCHLTFDAFGVALENYDLIGRFRTSDDAGRPIDSSVTLPDQIGGGSAANMVEVAQQIASTEAFAKCMGRNLINYALADTSAGSSEINSCTTKSVADAYAAAEEQTFSSLVRAVAASPAFASRSKGADQ
jgi:hypothetical protein